MIHYTDDKMKNFLYNLHDLWREIQIKGHYGGTFIDRAESLLKEADAFPDIEGAKDTSYREGYDEGYTEGRSQAYDEGFDDGVASVET